MRSFWFYDGAGNFVRSLDILAKKEYTYTYEGGVIVAAHECDVTLNGEIVTAKTVVNTIRYTYDADGQLTKKSIVPASGEAQITYYENREDANTVVKFDVNGKTVVSQSKNDSFGRKVFDELQLGTGFVSRQFSYHAGDATDQHVNSEKLKSTPTTQLVSEIILSDGRTLHYDYDAEERITKIVDCMDGASVTYAYTYDAQGQLLTETRDGVLINEMTYDGYGNILTKNGKTYGYNHELWKDLLTSYDGQSIIYDDQGNPVSYMGHTLTWEKGRQLKSFDGIAYTYNANGIRTSKTVDGVKHTYILDGTKILKETWGSSSIVPLYDNEDTVCGMIYDNTPYYFHKNLQGDIITITDKNGNGIVGYTYDAWGKCTVTFDVSGCDVATVNPYRYRGYYFDNETGMYYLQSRYYDAEIGRFVNGDDILFLGTNRTLLSYNLFPYCQNNCVMHIDASGFMSVSMLRMLSTIFNYNIISESTVALSVLALNGFGIYTAFHEIAQLNIAKKLKNKGFRNINLEYRIGNKGEADIVATKGKKYVWEVKPIGGNPNSQLNKYTNRTGYSRGYNIGTIRNIKIVGRLTMTITFNSSGGAFYAFYTSGRHVTNAELYRAIKTVIQLACAVAATIIIGTILEDIFTGGLGIWNDAPSFSGAASSMSPIILGGLRAFGVA